MFFSPVCFLPWRAAWPLVVKVSAQLKRAECGQGYFFFVVGVLVLLVLAAPALVLVADVAEVGVGSVWIVCDGGGREGVVVLFTEEGVGMISELLELYWLASWVCSGCSVVRLEKGSST